MKKPQVKTIAYVVLIGLAIWLGYGLFSRLNQAEKTPDRTEEITAATQVR